MASQNPPNEINFFYRDSPSRAMVSPLLQGEKDYHTWARKMKQTLLSKNMWGVIDGTLCPSFQEDPVNGLWQRCNKKVLGWILYSTIEPIRQTIMSFGSASEVWKNLHDRFSQSDITKIFHLQEQIFQAKQGSLSLQQYFIMFMMLWEDMESLRPAIMKCQCLTPCTCDAIRTSKIYRDQDCVFLFLMGLNERFAHLIHRILNLNPLPPIHEVVLFLSQNQQSATDGVSSVSESFVSNADQSNRSATGRGNGGRGNNHCTHCHKSNLHHLHNASSVNTDRGPMFQTTVPVTVVGFTQEQFQALMNLLHQASERSRPPSLCDFHSSSSSYHTAAEPSL
uniref:Retrotransposon Copia-like N-terminal domain-containing protein n=2 Tax=Phaseolus vulgaris TaxID=3885 RepID=V7B8R2_PHAVU|nr:hypothetical protein PHAVU_008G242300g [Phaseolus vulgaris]ESW13975.1 hypothetical protein PHAVU_008G242300g [Phaseolus vulgaris]